MKWNGYQVMLLRMSLADASQEKKKKEKKNRKKQQQRAERPYGR